MRKIRKKNLQMRGTNVSFTFSRDGENKKFGLHGCKRPHEENKTLTQFEHDENNA
jgi:hypothetical protein